VIEHDKQRFNQANVNSKNSNEGKRMRGEGFGRKALKGRGVCDTRTFNARAGFFAMIKGGVKDD
jgi:hypothetical protein